jgi:hypothetical protein
MIDLGKVGSISEIQAKQYTCRGICPQRQTKPAIEFYYISPITLKLTLFHPPPKEGYGECCKPIGIALFTQYLYIHPLRSSVQAPTYHPQ